jgi:hypothetical protein
MTNPSIQPTGASHSGFSLLLSGGWLRRLMLNVSGSQRMTSTQQRHPKLAFDVLIVAAGIAFLLLIWATGVRAGQPIGKGTGTVLGGLYATYLGLLFLLSYFFADATYILSFLRYVCEECTRGGRGRHMAFVYFALWLGLGGWLLQVGLGVF